MFGRCPKCQTLESEVAFLREELKRLTDRLLAVTQPQAYQAIHYPAMNQEDTYGSDEDDIIEYGIYGQRLIRVKKQ